MYNFKSEVELRGVTVTKTTITAKTIQAIMLVTSLSYFLGQKKGGQVVFRNVQTGMKVTPPFNSTPVSDILISIVQ